MYFVVPNLNGHFLNYVEMFKQRSDYEGHIILTSDFKSFLALIKLILSSTNGNKINLCFLHGEKHIIQSLLTAFFKNVNVSSIFYYGFNINSGFFKVCLSKLSIYLLSALNIRLFYLEKPERIIIPSLRSKFLYLPDPILIPYDFDVTTRALTIPKVLIAGYLDSRKCIDKILVALEQLLCDSNFEDIHVFLVGEQSVDVSEMLDSYLLTTNLKVFQENQRVTDEVLAKYIENSDVVSCVYDNHLGSSGMFINAVAYNKKVLFISEGVLSDFAIELGINVFVKESSAANINKTINVLLDDVFYQYSLISRIDFLKKRNKSEFIKLLYGGDILEK
ncbi:hypothetical protein EKG38_24125 [Shewanella canadensis]|uniref:Glycosyltransferase family 1 protein n=1 Tax=Shewanella canadensis TaxID=271096 RepID=A0A3S0KQH5_9GAMM|nr:hypothetical protein [Shewanella canadensis]RTR35963.1 hypothetical protein EKG38_24125 [Shewanella canadensis]